MASLRILLCSNGTRGCGNASRVVTIAAYLAKALEDCSILVLTDLSTIGRFKLADRVDYVHIPSFRSASPTRGLNIEYGSTLRIRRKIAQSAIKTFRPDFVMLDESVLSIPEEARRIVSCVVEELPEAKITWGLSDTLGEPDFVRHQWARNDILEILDRFANEIFIFGAARLFDVEAAYGVPWTIAQKFFYTGFLVQRSTPPRRVRENLLAINQALPMVLLALSGGPDDFALIDSYLSVLENSRELPVLQSLIVAGPSITSQGKHELTKRAKKLPNVILQRFGKHMLHYVRFADLVICTGGYSVMSEIAGHGKKAIVIPSLSEQPANLSRARLFHEHGLVTAMPPKPPRPTALKEMMRQVLLQPSNSLSHKNNGILSFEGYARLVERIRFLTEHMPAAQEVAVVA